MNAWNDWFELGFAFGIAHESLVKRFFRAHVIVIVKSQFATLAALQVLRHRFPSECLIVKVAAEQQAAPLEAKQRIPTKANEVNHAL
jgi:hypothetical protein